MLSEFFKINTFLSIRHKKSLKKSSPKRFSKVTTDLKFTGCYQEANKKVRFEILISGVKKKKMKKGAVNRFYLTFDPAAASAGGKKKYQP